MTTLQQTHLYREIHEQPSVVRRLLEKETATAQALADLIHGRAIDHIVIAARGTSANAGTPSFSAFSATGKRRSSDIRSTPGIDATASVRPLPSRTNTG